MIIAGINFTEISKTTVSMSAVLIMISVFVAWILWLYQRDSNNHFDVKDLICRDGKVDEKKFTRFGAWIVSTWGFVYLILDDQFSEWYFTGYMAMWVGNAIADKYFNKDQK